GAHHAEQHLHQGALAGSVLAQQADDLAGRDGEVDAAIGADRAVALVDAPHLQHETSPVRSDRRAHVPPRASSRVTGIFSSPDANFFLIVSISASTAAGTNGLNSRSSE